MKHLLLLLLGLALAPAAHAALPADTLKGQAQLVRQLSASLCERLTAENQKADLNKLPEAEAQTLFTQAVEGVMTENITAFQAMLQPLDTSKREAQAQQIGQQAVVKLMESCPLARVFITQLGMRATKQQASISAAERPVLTPIAQSICKRLDEENARQPFGQRAVEVRSQVMGQVMEAVVTANAQELTDYYGEDTLSDEAQMREIGTKIGLVVVEQCPSYIIMMGMDAAKKKAAASSAAPASPAPRKPATRTPAPTRRPTKK